MIKQFFQWIHRLLFRSKASRKRIRPLVKGHHLLLSRSSFMQAASADLSWSGHQSSTHEGLQPDPSSWVTKSPQQASAEKADPDQVVYSVSREEAINALNRTLCQSSLPDTLETNFQEALEKTAATSEIKDSTQSKAKPLVDFSDVAYLAKLKGDYREAERLYNQGLIRQRKTLGEEHPKVALILRSLANLYTLQSRHSEAVSLLQEALTIQQTQLCADSIETGETLYRLANLYRHQERYSDADTLFQQALAIFRQQLGADDPRTQTVYGDFMQMMAMLIEDGKFAELNTNLPPLDLNTLSDTYSWAKPTWAKGSFLRDN